MKKNKKPSSNRIKNLFLDKRKTNKNRLEEHEEQKDQSSENPEEQGGLS